MKRVIASLPASALLCLAAAPLAAQTEGYNPPVNPSLVSDQANDFFLRAKNVYDSAQAATDINNRRDLFSRASELFTEYLGSFPNHPNAEMAWWYLGNSHYQSGNPQEAKRAFGTLINRFGSGKWAAAASYTLAADAYNKGDFATAAPLFERYAAHAEKSGERARGNYLAGVSYQSVNRIPQAVAVFQQIVNDPQGGLFRDQANVALAHFSVKEGKLQDGLARFRLVADNASTQAKVRGEACLHAALTATKLGDAETASRYLDIILRTPGMDDFRPEAQTALMANLFAKKDYQNVIKTYLASPAKAEGEAEAARLMLAARSYMRLKQPAQALGLFRDVEKLVKPEGDIAFQAAYYRLLCFYQIEGRHVPDQVDAFLQLYRKSRSEDSRIHTALLMKAESLFTSGDATKAAKVFTEINAAALSAKNRPGLYYQRGWCLAEAGDNQGAIDSLTEFIKTSPDDPRVPTALAKRAKAYAATAETAKALADFDRLAKSQNSPDLVSYAWLESARMRRTEGNIGDMTARYQGLLKVLKPADRDLAAEANYWIGWGMVKQNDAKDSVSYLEKARELKPETFAKHAGILLAIGYFAAQEPEPLAKEIDHAFKEGYADEIPDQTLQWSAMQSFNARKFVSAARSLDQIATYEDPHSTPKEVWRYLAKSCIEAGKPEKALQAVNNLIVAEDDPGWKADALLDRARALAALKRDAEARKSVDEGLELRPQNRTKTHLILLSGDLYAAAGDFKKAAADYTIVVNFHDDREFRPLAMSKLADTFEKLGDHTEADKTRTKLAADYPDWKKPESGKGE